MARTYRELCKVAIEIEQENLAIGTFADCAKTGNYIRCECFFIRN